MGRKKCKKKIPKFCMIIFLSIHFMPSIKIYLDRTKFTGGERH